MPERWFISFELLLGMKFIKELLKWEEIMIVFRWD